MYDSNKELISMILTVVLLVLLIPIVNADGIMNENNAEETYLRVINKIRTPTQERFAGFRVLYDPRPQVDETDVPLRTSYFFIIEPDDNTDTIITDSIMVELKPEEGEAFTIMNGISFSEGYSGTCIVENGAVNVSIDSSSTLLPDTTYTIRVNAESTKGATIPPQYGEWKFTTHSAAQEHSLQFDLDLNSDPVTFYGSINGTVIPAFNTATWAQPMFDMMAETREKYPNAWTVQRDFYLTGSTLFSSPLNSALQPQPNIVRELETRRITQINKTEQGLELLVEDFFGHEQYGIPSNRPLTEDYKPGDVIQIGDKSKCVNSKVISVDNSKNIVLVEPYTEELGEWYLDYDGSVPTAPRPEYPGLFVNGGTYLRKFDPVGTPVYYWGILDHQWDALIRNGIRPMPNFVDAPGDISLDGLTGTTAKDLKVMRQVAYDITDHIIKRYGEDTINWHWSIFNEINISQHNWRTKDFFELQRFYDYTIDGIFKAFEDNGLDSRLVKVGGIEMGGLNGPNLSPLERILVHASPTAEASYALSENAVYADPELDGKRSQRMQEFGDKYNGKGSPLDFVAVHTYHTSANAAATMTAAKDLALQIDSEFFESLEVNNHESAPLWTGFNDVTGAELFLSNGYFSSWAADYITRLVHTAEEDSRYRHVGNILLTLWPWHPANFSPSNDIVREFAVRNKKELLPMQIYHFVSLLSTMGPEYWIFPAIEVERHNVSGLASQDDDNLYVMLYSHNIKDTQSRSDHEFEIAIDLKGYKENHFTVIEYQLDRDHNSYYNLGRKYKDKTNFTQTQFDDIKELSSLKPTKITEYNLQGNDEKVQITVNTAGNGVNFLKIVPGKYEEPDDEPTNEPTEEPTAEPTEEPSEVPTEEPTDEPTDEPTQEPTEQPTEEPTAEPTGEPTEEPDVSPTEPSDSQTEEPTVSPTETDIQQPAEQPDETGSSPDTGDNVIPGVILILLLSAVSLGFILIKRKGII